MDNLEVDQLHNASLLIQEGMKQASEGFLLVGSALSLVKREKLWAGHHKSFDEFMTVMNVKRSTGYRLVSIWDKWGEKAKGIQISRLSKLLPLPAEDGILEQARELNPGAFADRVRELKGRTPTDACDHSEVGSYCKGCGKRF